MEAAAWRWASGAAATASSGGCLREPGARCFGRRPVGESGGLVASAAPRKMQVGPLQTKSGCVDQL